MKEYSYETENHPLGSGAVYHILGGARVIALTHDRDDAELIVSAMNGDLDDRSNDPGYSDQDRLIRIEKAICLIGAHIGVDMGESGIGQDDPGRNGTT